MFPSRYNLIHALAATTVLLAVIFWQGPVAFWRQFVYGLAIPMTPTVMLQSFLLTALLFGALWLVLWASTLRVKGPRIPNSPPLNAIGLAARWSPFIIAIALGLNWLCAAGIERFAGVEPSDQELIKCFTSETTPLGVRLCLGFLVLFEAPLFEEPLFRGVLFRGFAASLPPWVAMAASGFLFAIVHVNAASFIALWFLGIAFAELYRRTGTLFAPMTAHALFNATNLALLPFLAP